MIEIVPSSQTYANETKNPSLPRNLLLRTFGKLLIVFSSKVNLVYLNMLPSASDKAEFFVKNFSKKSTLDDSDISLLVFPSRTNLKLHNFSVTPEMVKKVITNLD